MKNRFHGRNVYHDKLLQDQLLFNLSTRLMALQRKTAYLQLPLLLHQKVGGPAAPSIMTSPYFIDKQTEKANVSSQARGKKI